MARPDGSFQIRTSTAIITVIGTDLVVDASNPKEVEVITFSGRVSVRSIDPKIAGVVQVSPGQRTVVHEGQAPTPPQDATPEQLKNMASVRALERRSHL